MSWPRPLRPGDAAPGFALPALDREGMVRSDDYLGRSPIMVGFFRGLFCPFCRRQITQLGACAEKLRREGVETLGVLIGPVSRGRLYFRYHPARMSLAADEAAATHRAYGVPRFELLPGNGNGDAAVWPYAVTEEQVNTVRVNPNGIFPEPVLASEASELLNRADDFPWTEVDGQTAERHWTQLDGLFLIDRGGTVRWRYLEAYDDPTELGAFPSEDELVAAVRELGE
jgi:peroxiredoxin